MTCCPYYVVEAANFGGISLASAFYYQRRLAVGYVLPNVCREVRELLGNHGSLLRGTAVCLEQFGQGWRKFYRFSPGSGRPPSIRLPTLCLGHGLQQLPKTGKGLDLDPVGVRTSSSGMAEIFCQREDWSRVIPMSSSVGLSVIDVDRVGDNVESCDIISLSVCPGFRTSWDSISPNLRSALSLISAQ